MARDVTSRVLKAKLHILKAVDSGGRESVELQVSYTFKFKLLTRVELSGKGDLSLVLDGKVYTWGCEDEMGVARFVGCLSSLTREHLRRPLAVDGVDGATLERWIEVCHRRYINQSIINQSFVREQYCMDNINYN